MKPSRLTVGLAIVAGLVTACGSRTSGTENDPVPTLTRLDQERIQAQIGADAAALDRLYADDFIGVGPSGPVGTKPEVTANFTSGHLRSRIDCLHLEVRLEPRR